MILMNDFKAESKILKEDMLAAVSRVIDSGWYVLGHELEAFEQCMVLLGEKDLAGLVGAIQRGVWQGA